MTVFSVAKAMQLDPWTIRATWTYSQLWLACRTLDDFGRFESAQINKVRRKQQPREGVPGNVRYLTEAELMTQRPDLMQG